MELKFNNLLSYNPWLTLTYTFRVMVAKMVDCDYSNSIFVYDLPFDMPTT
jgi:hypothetical protein